MNRGIRHGLGWAVIGLLCWGLAAALLQTPAGETVATEGILTILGAAGLVLAVAGAVRVAVTLIRS